jgi:hypothetical protein
MARDEKAIAEAVRQWLREMELDFGTRVYTREEWRKRGEQWGNNAPVTITAEGEFNHLMNDYEEKDVEEAFFRRWDRFLSGLGLWWEFGYAWSIHLYEK